MSLTEVLPDVQSLSRVDKLRLIHYLAEELAWDESSLIEPEQSYPVWSPDSAFTAAAVMMQELEKTKVEKQR